MCAFGRLARPQLMGDTLKPISYYDTLEAALALVSDELDYVLVSTLTTFLLDEMSHSDVKVSSYNIIEGLVKRLVATSKRAPRVEVRYGLNL